MSEDRLAEIRRGLENNYLTVSRAEAEYLLATIERLRAAALPVDPRLAEILASAPMIRASEASFGVVWQWFEPLSAEAAASMGCPDARRILMDTWAPWNDPTPNPKMAERMADSCAVIELLREIVDALVAAPTAPPDGHRAHREVGWIECFCDAGKDHAYGVAPTAPTPAEITSANDCPACDAYGICPSHERLRAPTPADPELGRLLGKVERLKAVAIDARDETASYVEQCLSIAADRDYWRDQVEALHDALEANAPEPLTTTLEDGTRWKLEQVHAEFAAIGGRPLFRLVPLPESEK